MAFLTPRVRRAVRSAISLAILQGWALAAWGTTFVERPFLETLQGAPIIVRGTVGMKYSDWSKGSTAPGERRIYTFYELRVDEVLKGTVGERAIVMRELGGQKDGVGMEVAGSAKFERGEDVVVMLGARNADGTFDVHGLMMGRYEVRRDEEGREYLEGPGIAGARGHDHRAEVDGEPGAERSPEPRWSLDRVRETLARQAGSGGASASANPSAPASENPRAARDNGMTGDANQPAPRLQPEHPATDAASAEQAADGKSMGLVGWFLYGAVFVALTILLGLGGWFFFRRRLRK